MPSRSLPSRPGPVAVVLLPVLLLGAALAEAPATAPAPVQRVLPGDPFPPGSYATLNTAAGGPDRIDLADYLGEKPIILYYWIAGNHRSEQVFREVQELAAELGRERIALFGVAVPRPGLDEARIRERIEAVGIRVPVLSDTDFRIGRRLAVSSVPNITVIDRSGRLRLTNGGSLAQVLGYELDLAKAIRNTAETGELLSYGYLDRYHAVRELEGKPAPDFSAPLLEDDVERSSDSLLVDGKVNVLIFWSVDCGHCRKYLPQINDWVRAHPDEVNVVSCAAVGSETARTKTREFSAEHGLVFPTIVDRGARIGDLYNITATPTVVIVGPDGVVNGAIVSTLTDFGRTMERKKRELLSPRGSG